MTDNPTSDEQCFCTEYTECEPCIDREEKKEIEREAEVVRLRDELWALRLNYRQANERITWLENECLRRDNKLAMADTLIEIVKINQLEMEQNIADYDILRNLGDPDSHKPLVLPVDGIDHLCDLDNGSPCSTGVSVNTKPCETCGGKGSVREKDVEASRAEANCGENRPVYRMVQCRTCNGKGTVAS